MEDITSESITAILTEMQARADELRKKQAEEASIGFAVGEEKPLDFFLEMPDAVADETPTNPGLPPMRSGPAKSHTARKVTIGLPIVLVAIVVCIDRIFHYPAFGWLIWQGLRASAWMNVQTGLKSTVALIIAVVPIVLNVASFIRGDKDKKGDKDDRALKKRKKFGFAIGGVLLAIFAGTMITAKVLHITMVPGINDKTYARAAKICDNAGLNLPYSAELADRHIAFQFPRKGSIISIDDDVYTWETLDLFFARAGEVNSLFMEEDKENGVNKTASDENNIASSESYKENDRKVKRIKDPDKNSNMRATYVLSEDGTVEAFLYGWIIENAEGHDTIIDYYHWKEGEPYAIGCDRLRAYNYAHDIYFRSERTFELGARAFKFKDIKYTLVDGTFLPYDGFVEVIDDEVKLNGAIYYKSGGRVKYYDYDIDESLSFKLTRTYTGKLSSGDEYDGGWKNGKPHGQGTLTWADGDKYVGEFKNGKKNGQGTYTLANGEEYVGEWKNNKCSGQGVYTFVDGCKYVGKWKNNGANGQGTTTWTSGAKHVGKYRDGKMDGKGTYSFANGSVYKGNFVDGDQSGRGTLTNKDGEVLFDGIWKNDERWTGKGKLETVDDDGTVRIFEGKWRKGEYDGYGEWSYNTAGAIETYSGEFKDGKRNGYGEYHYIDGSVYKGSWKDDLREGQGKYYDNNGELIQDGSFKAGEYVG